MWICYQPLKNQASTSVKYMLIIPWVWSVVWVGPQFLAWRIIPLIWMLEEDQVRDEMNTSKMRQNWDRKKNKGLDKKLVKKVYRNWSVLARQYVGQATETPWSGSQWKKGLETSWARRLEGLNNDSGIGKESNGWARPHWMCVAKQKDDTELVR